MQTSLSRALAIVLLGAGLGLAANQFSPRRLPLRAVPKPPPPAGEFIALADAKRLWHGGAALFLDAREPADYAAGHIGNAFNLPALAFARHFGEIAPLLSRDSELVLYCDGQDCELSHRLRDSLHEVGYTNTHLLFNGWTAWRQAGLPVAGGRP